MAGVRKLTPAVHQAIVELVAEGAYLTTAAKIAGVSYSAARRWLARGESELDAQYQTAEQLAKERPPRKTGRKAKKAPEPRESIYARFARDVRRADAKYQHETAKQHMLIGLGRAPSGFGDAKALQWLLARKWPAEFGTWREQADPDAAKDEADDASALAGLAKALADRARG